MPYLCIKNVYESVKRRGILSSRNDHTCFVFVSAYAPIISICMHKILFVISFFCICIRMAGINCTILLFVYTYYISYGMPHFMFQLISAAILSEVQGVRAAGNSDFQCRS